eukprot:844010-Prymnesium_polylepis.1
MPHMLSDHYYHLCAHVCVPTLGAGIALALAVRGRGCTCTGSVGCVSTLAPQWVPVSLAIYSRGPYWDHTGTGSVLSRYNLDIKCEHCVYRGPWRRARTAFGGALAEAAPT